MKHPSTGSGETTGLSRYVRTSASLERLSVDAARFVRVALDLFPDYQRIGLAADFKPVLRNFLRNRVDTTSVVRECTEILLARKI